MKYKVRNLLLFLVVLVFCLLCVQQCWAEAGLSKNATIRKVRFTARVNLPDSNWVEVIRSGLDELTGVTDAVIGTTGIAISAGVQHYALPSDCAKVKQVCRRPSDGGKCLDKMDSWVTGKVHEGMSTVTDPVIAWWDEIDADMKLLGIHPVPAGTDSFIIFYRRNPRLTNLSYGPDSADVALAIRESYHTPFVTICKAYALEYADRYDKARYYRELFTTQVNWIKNDLAEPPSEIFLAPRGVPREP